jgi:phosphoribosylglycinamide formyltransferase-1
MRKTGSFSIAVLISGGGTTLRYLIDETSRGQLDVDIAVVISSNPASPGIGFAHEAGIPVTVVDHREYPNPPDLSEKVFAVCRQANVDLVVLGGFLRRLVIPEDFADRVINIHPSLLPLHSGHGMYGLRVHQAVIASGDKETGCTVHVVDNEYDHGPPIARRRVPVLSGDTPQALAARVFQAEQQLYPQVIGAIARGDVRISGEGKKGSGLINEKET